MNQKLTKAEIEIELLKEAIGRELSFSDSIERHETLARIIAERDELRTELAAALEIIHTCSGALAECGDKFYNMQFTAEAVSEARESLDAYLPGVQDIFGIGREDWTPPDSPYFRRRKLAGLDYVTVPVESTPSSTEQSTSSAEVAAT